MFVLDTVVLSHCWFPLVNTQAVCIALWGIYGSLWSNCWSELLAHLCSCFDFIDITSLGNSWGVVWDSLSKVIYFPHHIKIRRVFSKMIYVFKWKFFASLKRNMWDDYVMSYFWHWTLCILCFVHMEKMVHLYWHVKHESCNCWILSPVLIIWQNEFKMYTELCCATPTLSVYRFLKLLCAYHVFCRNETTWL